jgi:hypothetical protein
MAHTSRYQPDLLDEIDGALSSLLSALDTDASYGAFAAKLRRFVNQYSQGNGDPPFWQDWEDVDKHEEEICSPWILEQEICDKAVGAFYALGQAVRRLLLEATTPYHQQEYLAKLRQSLCDYLARRGYDVLHPSPTDNDENWITVSGASRVSGVNKGVISRAASAGEIRTNGKKERALRLHAGSFAQWQLQRTPAVDPSSVPSPTEVTERAREARRNRGVPDDE